MRAVISSPPNETQAAPTEPSNGQRELAQAARAGDQESRAEMILRNRRLALSLARRYQGRGVPHEDLAQEALLGLIIAVDRFDPDRGTAFSTYATFWIRQRLQRAVERTSPLTHLPGRRKTANALAELPPPSRPIVVSLDAPAKADSDTPLGELVPDPLSLTGDPLERLVRELATEAIHRIMDFLPDREREIVRARFGFDGTPKTLAEIGARLHLSHERVRQLLDGALGRLRHMARLVRLAELVEP